MLLHPPANHSAKNAVDNQFMTMKELIVQSDFKKILVFYAHVHTVYESRRIHLVGLYLFNLLQATFHVATIGAVSVMNDDVRNRLFERAWPF